MLENTPGSGDCESRVDVWGQPALFASSAAYVLAGLFVFWWARGRGPGFQVFAAGLILAGLGSMDYHGPALGPEPLLHDGGLAVALVAALAIDLAVLGVARRWRIGGLAILTVLALIVIAVYPQVSPALAGIAAVGLVAAEWLVYRRGLREPGTALWVGLAALAVGGVVFALSRTGGPLCDPDSLVQGHALWHVLTALALALWGVTATRESKS